MRNTAYRVQAKLAVSERALPALAVGPSGVVSAVLFSAVVAAVVVSAVLVSTAETTDDLAKSNLDGAVSAEVENDAEIEKVLDVEDVVETELLKEGLEVDLAQEDVDVDAGDGVGVVAFFVSAEAPDSVRVLAAVVDEATDDADDVNVNVDVDVGDDDVERAILARSERRSRGSGGSEEKGSKLVVGGEHRRRGVENVGRKKTGRAEWARSG